MKKNRALNLRWCIILSGLILIIGVIILLNNNFTSGQLSVKSYEKIGDYGKITITDAKTTNKLAEYTLTKNTDICFIDCYAEGTIKLYKDNYLLSNIDFQDYKTKDSRNLNYRITINDGSGWRVYNNKILKVGTYSWRIDARKYPYETIDWIVTTYGEKLDEWALWSAGSNIVAYYKLDETTGTNAVDAVQGKYNLTTSTNVAWITGKINNALKFYNGKANATLVSPPLFDTYTWNLWINITNTTSQSSIIGVEAAGTINDTYIKHIDTGSGVKIYIQHDDTLGTNYIYSNNSISLNNWMMITFVTNKSGSYIYLNGTLNNFTAINFGTTGDLGQFGIGSIKDIGTTNGTIDEVGVWSRSLSDTEITELYNSGSGLTYPSLNTITLNNLVYNESTYGSSSEDIVANISYNSTKFPNIYMDLIYNDVLYSTTKAGTGDNLTFSKSISIIAPYGNKEFFLNFTYGNSTNNYTDTSIFYTQSINNFSLGICNSTLTIPYVNFSFYDETTSAKINASANSITWYYWIDSATQNKTFTYSTSTNYSNYTFCFSPTDKTFNNNLLFQYSLEGYPTKKYSYIGAYTNTTTQTSLGLLSSSDGIYTTFQVLSPAEQPLSGVYITGERISGSTYTLIGSGITDDAGTLTLWVNPDYSHEFNFSKSGYDNYSTIITPTQSLYTVHLTSTTITTNLTDYSQGITYSIYPVQGLLNNRTIYNFNMTLSSNYFNLDKFGFVISNGSDDIISNSSTVGTGGFVSLNLNTSDNTTLVMNYYWVISGNYTNLTARWYVRGEGDYGYSIKTFFTDLKTFADEGIFGLDSFGLTLIVFFFIFIVVGLMSYYSGIYSPAAIAWMIFVLVAIFDIGAGWIISPSDKIPYFATIFIGLIAIGFTFWEASR